MLRLVEITLKEPARTQAASALHDLGLLPTNKVFLGPRFEGHLLADFLPDFLKVTVFRGQYDAANYRRAEAIYFYPLADIARVKTV